ncbi:hypothetical protein K435DRAFT_877343 [Dendrothele bispora CBS 962.96]|uniref:Heterokaryon incompatibility domain-containing protein n=1 Tax=Dendrothele bispora (strain CBS 962.96) TaxID=1314807 RepID=A0A4S8KQ52_DENBC|nr:hypothetical protein K435DRAFT_877343 [Dendrothele bispora CBS 962.96]
MGRIVKDVMELKKSRWFMRGWTLQELIAPRYMVFLDKDWDKISTRYGIRHVVSELTSIPVEVFERGRLDDYSIAQKMSWATSRKTTREEGHGILPHGFIRGQTCHQSMEREEQRLLFVYNRKLSSTRMIGVFLPGSHCRIYHRDRGMFASSPSEFVSSGKCLRDTGKDIFYASLHCRDPNGVIGIYLQKQGHRYIRWRPYFSLSHTDKPLGKLQEVVVKESTITLPQQRFQYDNIPVEFKPDSDVSLQDGNRFFLPRDSRHMFGLRTKKGNTFDVVLRTRLDDVIPLLWMWFLVNDRWVDDDGHSLQDSRLLPIDNENALVSFFAHTTGDSSNQRIVEINYIPSSTAKFQLYRQICTFRCTSHALTSKTLNFAVDALPAYLRVLSIPSVFPSEFRWVGDGKEVFDVFASTDTLPISDVWESYLSLGSRYKCRKIGTATTALDEWSSLIVTVEKEILLGSAWYHVVLTQQRSH